MNINLPRHYSSLDQFLIHLDQGVRTLFSPAQSERISPDQTLSEPKLTQSERRTSGALMRVNHTGEISAQALYHAQALTARSLEVRDSMQKAADEENDHLAWCERRLKELDNRPSYLNPFWYTGSFLIGMAMGCLGDKWNLGFLAETEQQVVQHLQSHLKRLPEKDIKSKAVLEQMQEDEAHHATTAHHAGAAELPIWVKQGMRCLSGVMTKVAYWI